MLLTMVGKTILPPPITPKFASMPNYSTLMCCSCKLAQQKQHNRQVKQSKAGPDKEGLLSMNRYKTGNFVSADQFVVKTLGCCFLVLVKRIFMVYSMVVLSFRMLHLLLFGLSFKFLWVIEKQ